MTGVQTCALPIFVFYPFYLCGQLITKQDILKINTNKALKVVGALILLIWLVLSITNADMLTVLRPLFTGRNSFSSDELFVKWGFLYRLLCYLITSLLCFAVISVMPGRKIPLVSDYGTRTLQVYFWHWPFVRLLQLTGAEEALMGSGFGMTLWIIIGVALTFILSTKPFSFPTKQIFKYCRYQTDTDK